MEKSQVAVVAGGAVTFLDASTGLAAAPAPASALPALPPTAAAAAAAGGPSFSPQSLVPLPGVVADASGRAALAAAGWLQGKAA